MSGQPRGLVGQFCPCGEPAWHKVAEEMLDGAFGHGLSQDLCPACFQRVLRPYEGPQPVTADWVRAALEAVLVRVPMNREAVVEAMLTSGVTPHPRLSGGVGYYRLALVDAESGEETLLESASLASAERAALGAMAEGDWEPGPMGPDGSAGIARSWHDARTSRVLTITLCPLVP